tara:strand:- start:226 stop:1290 length:1065 start_codon:yes stop_codon:yes gene_type:complete
LVVYSQTNLDTIYGNPKSVREKVEFLSEKKQNYVFMSGDGDYGHATIFTPKGIKSRFHLYWYNYHWVFYVNYYKEFLENGKAKNETWYNKDGSFEREYKYTYDEKNNLTEKKEIYYDGEYNLTKYSYDYRDRIMSCISSYSNMTDLYSYALFKYDSLGRLVKTSRYRDEGYSGSIFRKYNKFDSIVREFRHSPKKWVENEDGSRTYKSDSVGSWQDIYRCKYNENKNLVLKASYRDGSDKISSRTIYKYDERNNVIYEGYARDTVYAYRKYKYDLKNRKIYYEYSVINNDFTKKLVEYRYNERGYIVNVLCFFQKKEYNIDYKYKFDEKGNWIKIIKVVNNEPLYVWSRKIKYY